MFTLRSTWTTSILCSNLFATNVACYITLVFAVYVVVFGVLLIIQLASGLEAVSAFAAVAVTLNNLGPGLGEIASGFGDVCAVGKWSAVCGMLLGRLEIFTLLVLITPTFWRP